MRYDEDVVKISIVGLGMRSHAGVAAKMFKILADEAINIQAISTSEIKISCLVAAKYTELAVRAQREVHIVDGQVVDLAAPSRRAIGVSAQL